MNRLLVVVAIVFLAFAILIKLTTMGRLVPGLLPVNWIKLTDTLLLISIALSLLGRKT